MGFQRLGEPPGEPPGADSEDGVDSRDDGTTACDLALSVLTDGLPFNDASTI